MMRRFMGRQSDRRQAAPSDGLKAFGSGALQALLTLSGG